MFQFTRLVCLFAASVAGSSLAKKLARRTGHRAPAQLEHATWYGQWNCGILTDLNVWFNSFMLAPLRCALGDYTRGDVMTDCSDQNHSETSVGQGTQYLICARCWGERKKYSVCN